MELRIELDADDEGAWTDLTDLLRDEGIAYRYDDADDPNALGPDPVAVIGLVLSTITTVTAVLTTVMSIRAGRKGKVVAKDGREAEIGTDRGKLGEILQRWIFEDGQKAP